jgi:hypothetical protein
MGSRGFTARCLEHAAAAIGDQVLPRARATLLATASMAQLDEGAWQRADALAAEAVAGFDECDAELVWERNTATMLTSFARWHRGELASLVRYTRGERDRVSARGDLYGHELVHVGFMGVSDLLAGDAAAASARLDELDTRPTGVLTAWLRAIAHAQVGTYGERFAHHRARTDALLGKLLALPVLRSPLFAMTSWWARLALELAAGPAADRRLIARGIRRLEATRCRGAVGLARLGRANALQLAGDPSARDVAGSAALALAADDLPLFAAAADALALGAKHSDQLLTRLAQQGAVDPARFARLLAPALPL